MTTAGAASLAGAAASGGIAGTTGLMTSGGIAGTAGVTASSGSSGTAGMTVSSGIAGTTATAAGGVAGSGIFAAAGGIAGTTGITTSGGIASTAGGSGQVNHLPVITALAFSPTLLRTNDLLKVAVTASDPDSDPVAYAFAWTRNGEPVGTDIGQLDGRTSFSKGDVLRVKVTPMDGKGIGAAVTSDPITVQNSPPSAVPKPALSPIAFADDNAELQCLSAGEVTDPDGDTITYGFGWQLDGQVSAQSTNSLAATDTLPGQKWVCQVTATDGTETVKSNLSAQTWIITKVSGIVRTNTTWQAVKSPYYLTDLVQVGADVTLTVEPGVYVMGNGKSLQTMGGVSMVGTAAKPIRVTALHLSDLAGESSKRDLDLRFVQWEGGGTADNLGNSQLRISDCVVEEQDIGLWMSSWNAAFLFERNVFRNICRVQISNAASMILRNNVFIGNASNCIPLYLGTGLLSVNYNSFLSTATTATTIESGAADAKSNYWGGLADIDVPSQIYDGNDNLTISGTVEYLPTLSAPHADTPAPDKRYFPAGAP